jgi:hypothetical protein
VVNDQVDDARIRGEVQRQIAALEAQIAEDEEFIAVMHEGIPPQQRNRDEALRAAEQAAEQQRSRQRRQFPKTIPLDW